MLSLGPVSASAAVTAISNIETFSGDVVIDGVAPAGARIEVWLDDGRSEPLRTEVVADSDGIWRVEPGSVGVAELESCRVTVSALMLFDDGTAVAAEDRAFTNPGFDSAPQVDDSLQQPLELSSATGGGGVLAGSPVWAVWLLLGLVRSRCRLR